MSLTSRAKADWKRPLSVAHWMLIVFVLSALTVYFVNTRYIGTGIKLYESYSTLMQLRSNGEPKHIGKIIKVEPDNTADKTWSFFQSVTATSGKITSLLITTSTGMKVKVDMLNHDDFDLVGTDATLHSISISDADPLHKSNKHKFFYSALSNYKQICFETPGSTASAVCGLSDTD
ncbi:MULTISPECIES: hypothetical protein [Providencia]|uniref:hypothetical protein n=1 Tax=Providencia TaxID=586 RepID=UPI00313D9B23